MRHTLVVLILVLAAFAAVADNHSETPDPMLKQLDYFTGKWQCSGTAYANPMTPEHATQAEVNAKWDLNGNWVPFSYSEKKTAANPTPFTFTGFFGYDKEIKKFVVGGVDNMGGYSTLASDGWSGDSMIFTGPWHMNGMTANSRDVFTKKGDREMTHVGEIEMNGKWTKMSMETCRK